MSTDDRLTTALHAAEVHDREESPRDAPAPTCELCGRAMEAGTSGHGLGECVDCCDACDGSGWFEGTCPTCSGSGAKSRPGNLEAQERSVSALWAMARALGIDTSDADGSERVHRAVGSALREIMDAFGFEVTALQ